MGRLHRTVVPLLQRAGELPLTGMIFVKTFTQAYTRKKPKSRHF